MSGIAYCYSSHRYEVYHFGKKGWRDDNVSARKLYYQFSNEVFDEKRGYYCGSATTIQITATSTDSLCKKGLGIKIIKKKKKPPIEVVVVPKEPSEPAITLYTNSDTSSDLFSESGSDEESAIHDPHDS